MNLPEHCFLVIYYYLHLEVWSFLRVTFSLVLHKNTVWVIIFQGFEVFSPPVIATSGSFTIVYGFLVLFFACFAVYSVRCIGSLAAPWFPCQA